MIKPLFKNDLVTLYCSDSRIILPELDNADCLITDPPYGIWENYEKQQSRGKLAQPTAYKPFNWDEKIDKEFLDMVRSKAKKQIIWGGNYYANWLPASGCWLVWDKRVDEKYNSDFSDCELAWTNIDARGSRMFRFLWQGMIQEHMGKHKEKRVHPTQKPVPLMDWIIERYTKPGELILDPFAGSGTTAVSASKLCRRCIVIESREDYCQTIIDRCSQRVLDLDIPVLMPEEF